MTKENEMKLIEQFKAGLIQELKDSVEEDINRSVKSFENRLREKASAKIVSFVDTLKIVAKNDISDIIPKIVIEVHL